MPALKLDLVYPFALLKLLPLIQSLFNWSHWLLLSSDLHLSFDSHRQSKCGLELTSTWMTLGQCLESNSAHLAYAVNICLLNCSLDQHILQFFSMNPIHSVKRNDERIFWATSLILSSASDLCLLVFGQPASKLPQNIQVVLLGAQT